MEPNSISHRLFCITFAGWAGRWQGVYDRSARPAVCGTTRQRGLIQSPSRLPVKFYRPCRCQKLRSTTRLPSPERQPVLPGAAERLRWMRKSSPPPWRRSTSNCWMTPACLAGSVCAAARADPGNCRRGKEEIAPERIAVATQWFTPEWVAQFLCSRKPLDMGGSSRAMASLSPCSTRLVAPVTFLFPRSGNWSACTHRE